VLEPAQETLLLVAAQRRTVGATFHVLKDGLRRGRAELREAMEVCRTGDEGMRRQSEQQQTHGRPRPHKLLHLTAQLFAQTL